MSYKSYNQKAFTISNIELDKFYDTVFNKTKVDKNTKEELHKILTKTLYKLLSIKLDKIY